MIRILLATIVLSTAWPVMAKGPQPVSRKSMTTKQLAIPPRLQWVDRAGYCGECSIQQSALFYGNYVSQFVCREIIDPEQEQDVLVCVNADQVLAALRLKYEEFDTAQTPVPQYQSYLAWTKRHLDHEHPVIMAMYARDETARDYDHIVLATGFAASHLETYRPDDILYFNDLFKSKPQKRSFMSLHDTRAMKGNGAQYDFCIPRDYNFGCAITGIEDETKSLLPIRVSIDREDEPDVVQQETPVPLALRVTVRNLRPGSSYVLYRYDNHKDLPARDFHSSKSFSARTFVATASTREFTDECRSNGAAFYRCLPAPTNPATSVKK